MNEGWKLAAIIGGISIGIFLVVGVGVLALDRATAEVCPHPIETIAAQDGCTTYYVCGTGHHVYYTHCDGVASTSHTDCHDETRLIGKTITVEKVCETRTLIEAPKP